MLLYGNQHGGSMFNNNVQINNNFSGLGINMQNGNLNGQINTVTTVGLINQNGPVGYPSNSALSISPHLSNVNSLPSGGVNGLQLQYPSGIGNLNVNNGFPNQTVTSGLINAHSLLNNVGRSPANNNSASNNTSLQSPRTIVKTENPSR